MNIDSIPVRDAFGEARHTLLRTVQWCPWMIQGWEAINGTLEGMSTQRYISSEEETPSAVDDVQGSMIWSCPGSTERIEFILEEF